MHSITYGGVQYKQVRNALYCKQCKQTIESKHHHDFKMCLCGTIGIDGGPAAGSRIIGDIKYMEPRSMYSYSINKKVYWLPQEIIEEHFYLNET